MQEVLINIEDYFDYDEIKEMVKSETAYAIRDKVDKTLRSVSISDIVYNVAHKIVIQILKEQEVDLHKKIAEKTLECIDELSIYYVLRNDDNGEKSKAQQVLDECVEEARPKIQEKINEIIEDKLNADWLINEVTDAFYNKLHDQLVGK